MTLHPKRSVSDSPDNILRHGQRSTYVNHRCRCDACRAAHAAYYRKSGGNRRVGARAATKRRADENLKHPCEGCGAVLVYRQRRICLNCWLSKQRETQRETRREIERRFQRGDTLKEIAAALGTTAGAIGVALVRMRESGEYDVPPRPPGGLRRKVVVA